MSALSMLLMVCVKQMRWFLQLAPVVLLLPDVALTVRIGDSSDDLTTMNTSRIDPGLLEEDEDQPGFNNLATDFDYPTKTSKMLRRILAAAAADIYDLATKPFIGTDSIISLKECHEQDQKNNHPVRWGIYEISRSHADVPQELKRKKILAFRGTDGKTDLATDLSLMGGHNPWSNFGKAVKYGIEVANKKKPHFVTGHSLGGAVAEMVAVGAEEKITGASWNGPSVCSRNPATNHCGSLKKAKATMDEDKHNFEVWITAEDVVSTMSVWTMKTEDSHTAKPHNVSCPTSSQQKLTCTSPLPAHSMECMIKQKEIGRLPSSSGGCNKKDTVGKCGR